jgi:hypothetical protein
LVGNQNGNVGSANLQNLIAIKQPLITGSCWSIGGTAIPEINATSLTFKCRPERPVWLKHLVKLADSNWSCRP